MNLKSRILTKVKTSEFCETVAFLRVGKEKHTMVLGIRTEEGVASYTVGEAFYLSVGAPRVGDVIDADTKEELLLEHERREAMKIALRLLAFADNSERTLTEKLRRKGVSREIAEETVRETVRLGYLDELRALRVLVLAAANGKLHGPYRVRAELSAKGYAPEKVNRVLTELVDAGDIDFSENFSRLLEKHAGDAPSPEEIQKYRIKYGYGSC